MSIYNDIIYDFKRVFSLYKSLLTRASKVPLRFEQNNWRQSW